MKLFIYGLILISYLASEAKLVDLIFLKKENKIGVIDQTNWSVIQQNVSFVMIILVSN